jgi:DNA repair exonuclease SbcCD nuclease subunit
MNKAVVIGDCHFTNAYPSFDYLEKQLQTIEHILLDVEDADYIIFLGDVFHFRKPDPETIVKVKVFFKRLCKFPTKKIFIVRGNHDTASKSDDSLLTILDVLDYPQINIVYDSKVEEVGECLFGFIAHFERDEEILTRLAGVEDKLALSDQKKFIFGHFGYTGCLNTNGDEDFGLSLNVFKHPTFLGHIHKPVDEGNVHVVGTPYSTAFSESDNHHRYAVIDTLTGEYTFKKINFGIRYLCFEYSALEANKDFINDRKYKTILRVLLNNITDTNSVDLRKNIMEEYDVEYVDIKYLPLIDNESHQSSFRPNSLAFDFDDDLIFKYVEECNSLMSKEVILEGLKLIKELEDS